VSTAQSLISNFQGIASTYFTWSGHFMLSSIKCLFRDMRTNFYWNRFLFDRIRAKKMSARILRHGVFLDTIIPKSQKSVKLFVVQPETRSNAVHSRRHETTHCNQNIRNS